MVGREGRVRARVGALMGGGRARAVVRRRATAPAGGVDAELRRGAADLVLVAEQRQVGHPAAQERLGGAGASRRRAGSARRCPRAARCGGARRARARSRRACTSVGGVSPTEGGRASRSRSGCRSAGCSKRSSSGVFVGGRSRSVRRWTAAPGSVRVCRVGSGRRRRGVGVGWMGGRRGSGRPAGEHDARDRRPPPREHAVAREPLAVVGRAQPVVRRGSRRSVGRPAAASARPARRSPG